MTENSTDSKPIYPDLEARRDALLGLRMAYSEALLVESFVQEIFQLRQDAKQLKGDLNLAKLRVIRLENDAAKAAAAPGVPDPLPGEAALATFNAVQAAVQAAGTAPARGPLRVEEIGAEELAQLFHESYERLAPNYGYKTREESAKPWEDVPEQNRHLMAAVCEEMIALLSMSK
jgi:hypothetical protein